jgi:hypothetical protein
VGNLAEFLDGLQESPHAEIEPIGRWTWRVFVSDGLTEWGPDGYGWRVLGKRRVERKAHKVLARYLRERSWFDQREQVP